MAKTVDCLRTISNQMIVGKIIEAEDKVMVFQPFGLIPTKDGLTLIPYDIDLTGTKMEQVTFKAEHVLYTTIASEQLAAEYIRILEGKPEQPEQPAPVQEQEQK
jgi:ABC-type proline/glycine betaine transport system ATPase subunit